MISAAPTSKMIQFFDTASWFQAHNKSGKLHTQNVTPPPSQKIFRRGEGGTNPQFFYQMKIKTLNGENVIGFTEL